MRWDSGKGFYVPDLYVRSCNTLNDMMQVPGCPQCSLAEGHKDVPAWFCRLQPGQRVWSWPLWALGI